VSNNDEATQMTPFAITSVNNEWCYPPQVQKYRVITKS
jgi:hypothetical protein